MRLSILLLCLLPLAISWWDEGHMITARIAYNYLNNTGRTVARDQFEQLIAAFYPFTDGRSNSFMEAAVWADDIKSYKATFFDNYHFVNIPHDPHYLLKGMTEVQYDINSINIINWCMNVLKSNKAGVSFERAFMARYLLHLIGDIHQPLHNTMMFNETYKTGDLGGNLIHITTISGADINLHSYFDSIAEEQDTKIPIVRPLSPEDRKKIEDMSELIMKRYPASQMSDLVSVAIPHSWGVEAYQIAVNKIYSFFSTTKQVTESYQSEIRSILQKQLALGGYRLANAIASIYA